FAAPALTRASVEGILRRLLFDFHYDDGAMLRAIGRPIPSRDVRTELDLAEGFDTVDSDGTVEPGARLVGLTLPNSARPRSALDQLGPSAVYGHHYPGKDQP